MPDDPTRRRRGRPTLDPTGAKSTCVGVRLIDKDFFAAARLARQRRESIQELLRRGLKHEIEHPTR
jgi:hypothetical protein